MTPWLYIQCVLMFIFGQGFCLFFIDIQHTKKLYKTAQLDFDWKAWWKHDWNIVIGVQFIGAMAILGLDQILHLKPQMLEIVKWFFAFLGAFGSAIGTRFSQYRKIALDVFDGFMSNKADQVKDTIANAKPRKR